MTMSTTDRLRLYLRDSSRGGRTTFFSEEELAQILEETSSIEEAAAFGWLLKAGSAVDSPRTLTVGQVSETRGQATESFNAAMKMHAYWDKKAGIASGSYVGRWYQIQPDGGLIGDLIDTAAYIEEQRSDYDLSKLWG
jgi:hypothetical protein